jgi:hypothetical protein
LKFFITENTAISNINMVSFDNVAFEKLQYDIVQSLNTIMALTENTDTAVANDITNKEFEKIQKKINLMKALIIPGVAVAIIIRVVAFMGKILLAILRLLGYITIPLFGLGIIYVILANIGEIVLNSECTGLIYLVVLPYEKTFVSILNTVNKMDQKDPQVIKIKQELTYIFDQINILRRTKLKLTIEDRNFYMNWDPKKMQPAVIDTVVKIKKSMLDGGIPADIVKDTISFRTMNYEANSDLAPGSTAFVDMRGMYYGIISSSVRYGKVIKALTALVRPYKIGTYGRDLSDRLVSELNAFGFTSPAIGLYHYPVVDKYVIQLDLRVLTNKTPMKKIDELSYMYQQCGLYHT